MVLNKVTEFHKILIKTIQFGEQTSLGVTDGIMNRQTDRGNT